MELAHNLLNWSQMDSKIKLKEMDCPPLAIITAIAIKDRESLIKDMRVVQKRHSNPDMRPLLTWRNWQMILRLHSLSDMYS
jgi:hypothetical protein